MGKDDNHPNPPATKLGACRKAVYCQKLQVGNDFRPAVLHRWGADASDLTARLRQHDYHPIRS